MTTIASGHNNPFKGAAKMFFGKVNYFIKVAQRERLRSELHQMSDRQLSDIGINRGEIESIVRSTHARCKHNA